LRSVRGTGNGRHWAASVATGTFRQIPTLTGLDRHKTGADRPGLFYGVIDTHFVFYDVFDKNFQNIMPFNTT
jgi:hypothetical protein